MLLKKILNEIRRAIENIFFLSVPKFDDKNIMRNILKIPNKSNNEIRRWVWIVWFNDVRKELVIKTDFTLRPFERCSNTNL